MTDDARFERRLGHLLRGGVVLAAAVTLVGGVMRLVRHGAMPVHDAVFAGEPARLRHVATIVTAALAGDPPAVVQLGVLLLVGTPVARVAASLVRFGLERDGVFVGVTLTVLAALLGGLLLS